MTKIIPFPKKAIQEPKESSFSMSKWLNEHCGCDADKMMAGDSEELKKMERHFAKKTPQVRTQLIEKEKGKHQ